MQELLRNLEELEREHDKLLHKIQNAPKISRNFLQEHVYQQFLEERAPWIIPLLNKSKNNKKNQQNIDLHEDIKSKENKEIQRIIGEMEKTPNQKVILIKRLLDLIPGLSAQDRQVLTEMFTSMDPKKIQKEWTSLKEAFGN